MIPRKVPQHGVETGGLQTGSLQTGSLRSPATPIYHGDIYGENRRLAARVHYPFAPNDQIPQSPRYIALQVHSLQDGGDLYVGVGPYGNLWDALVSGDITVVSIDGRLSDPSNPGDSGWISIGDGDNLYLKCTVTEGDISEATLEIGTSSDLCEFTDYTQTSFRVILAQAVGDTVIPLHEGELVSFFDIINGKLAKYAR